MMPHQIRTRTEKILTPFAFVFSGLIWLGLLFWIIYPFFTTPPPVEPCIYLFENEYLFISPEEAKNYGYTKQCIPKEKIPSDVYQNAKETLSKELIQTQRAMSGIGATVFFYFLAILAFIYAATALSMAYIRLNAIKISKTQYSVFYKIYEETAKALGIEKIPDAYIIYAGGELNAFAVKVSRKRMIVFFAELVEALIEGEKFDELRAVAAHELTHVHLRHTHYWLFLEPFMLLPFLGSFFSRVREFSADRGAWFVIQNEHTVTQALVKLVAGKFIAKEINIEDYLNQPKTERGFFIWLAKIIASHPPIPYRIQSIRKIARNGP